MSPYTSPSKKIYSKSNTTLQYSNKEKVPENPKRPKAVRSHFNRLRFTGTSYTETRPTDSTVREKEKRRRDLCYMRAGSRRRSVSRKAMQILNRAELLYRSAGLKRKYIRVIYPHLPLQRRDEDAVSHKSSTLKTLSPTLFSPKKEDDSGHVKDTRWNAMVKEKKHIQLHIFSWHS